MKFCIFDFLHQIGNKKILQGAKLKLVNVNDVKILIFNILLVYSHNKLNLINDKN